MFAIHVFISILVSVPFILTANLQKTESSSSSNSLTENNNYIKDVPTSLTNSLNLKNSVVRFERNLFVRDIHAENAPAAPSISNGVHSPPENRPNPPEDAPNPSFVNLNLNSVPKQSSQSTSSLDDTCGQSSTQDIILGGNSVPRGAYPWLVAIFKMKKSGLEYMCGGSLISDRHVVSAAHCFRIGQKQIHPYELTLVLGKVDIQNWLPVKEAEVLQPLAIHIHPDFKANNADADLAVLVLSRTLTFTKYIRPICLWRGSNDLRFIVGNYGIVTGWGMDETGVIQTQEPKQTNLPVVSQEKCLASNKVFHLLTSNRTFCAGGRDGIGPCNGNSGGGFIMNRNGKWELKGILALALVNPGIPGRGCDLSNYLVFCDVSKHLDWLQFFLQ